MGRAGAHRPAGAGLCGALALLVAVVTLLCALGQVDREDPLLRSAAAVPTAPETGSDPSAAPGVSTASEASATADATGGSTAPCKKKAVGEHSVQRGEGAPQAAGCSGHAAPQTAAAPLHAQHAGTLSGGPAPPCATPLHSVLRI